MKTWLRHLLAIALLLSLTWLFSWQRTDLPPVHFWNRSVADAAFVMLCLTLMIGPAVKFVPKLSFLLPWRRELGIGFTVGALLHVVIYTDGLQWNILKFFTQTKDSETVLLRTAFAAANWIGVIALLYAIVLALTSNNFSQRQLGKGWKFLQQQSYTLFILVVLHAGLLLYLVIQARHGIFRPVFWVATGLTVAFQTAGYLRTVRLLAKQRRLRAQRR